MKIMKKIECFVNLNKNDIFFPTVSILLLSQKFWNGQIRK